MSGQLHAFLAADHSRLDDLLTIFVNDEFVDEAPYETFREGLLRHIGMEEKILLPTVRRLRGGDPLPLARQLKLDHAALAALLVPTPTPRLVAQLRALLAAHNALEEGRDGLYDTCESLVGKDIDALVDRLRNAPRVPLALHNNGPEAFNSINLLLRAAARSE